ncbi:MAG: DPP IV N-terminal domain-containing protein, partial [Prolixibacteraceae bacterium]
YRLAERFSPTKISKMVFSTSVTPKWLKTGDQFWYTDTTSEGVSFYLVDLDKRSKTYLFDNHAMASMLTKITRDPYDWQHLPVIKPRFKKNDTVFQFDVTSSQDEEKTKDLVAKSKSNQKKDSTSTAKDSLQAKKGIKPGSEKDKVKKAVFHLEYNLKTGELTQIKDWKEEKENPDWANISPNGEYILFGRDYNLFWMDKENYKKAKKDEKDSTVVEHQLTTDGIKDYGYGGGYTPASNDDEKKIKEEKKKRKGAYLTWSRDSKKFALIRDDSRKVKDLWVINVLKEPRPELETYKYQMPGEKEAPQDELWIFDWSTKKGKKISIDQFKDQNVSIHRANLTNKQRAEDYVPSMWLSETSDKLFFTRASRDLYRTDICSVNTETGETKVLIEERMNTYIETKRLQILGNGKELVHWSERDGWGHFYLYDENGILKNQITSGPWHCSDIVRLDEKNRVLYFTANGREAGENPYYDHLYRVNLDGTGLQLLNPGNYTYNSEMSDSYKYFVNTYSRVNTAPKSEIRDALGKPVMELAASDLKNLFAAGYKFPEPFKAKAADGITDIYGVMYKPFDFDSTKVYPLIEYVYPGPQTEAVNAAFSSRMDRTDRLAQLGFIVITLGNRGGNPNRSKWYHNYGYGDLRDYGLADKKYVAEELADKYKFIDITRVGITGHSGGGFMSTAALCQYPDFFKVAVSSSGNHENQIYNRWWSETHQGVKEMKNNEGETLFVYDIEKNTQLAKNLKGNLLLITGDIDNNVHPGNTLRMVNALIKANKRFDFFILPGERHPYGSDTEYVFWLKGDYFCKHLIGDSSISTDIFEMNRETKMTSGKKN